MIVDAHAHLSETPYGGAGKYLAVLRGSGIDQGVVVPGGMLDVRKMTDYITGRAKVENPIPNNRYVRAACRTAGGKLHGMICLDPHDGNALADLEAGLREGDRGLKLSPLSHEFSFASRAVADLAACCGAYGVPVYSHVVYSPGASTARFVGLARQFPRTNFILGHMGFGPADGEGLAAAATMDNLFLETSTGSYLHLVEALRRAGPGKLIFGSEFPLSHPAVEIQKILLLDLSDGERELILGGNISALLHLAGPAKAPAREER
ncbi:MAG: amidohydrolase family protein [Patescibacteria group bacterium]